MITPILTLNLGTERDVVMARQRARQLGRLLGFDNQDQTRLATAVSEIARNAFRYAGGGKVEFLIQGSERGPSPSQMPAFVIRVFDRGPGIASLDAVLDGTYQSSTGMGLGIIGTRRLTDVFEIQSSTEPGIHGTQVLLGKYLPKGTTAHRAIDRIAGELAKEQPSDPLEEIQLQNQELLATLEALRAQKEAVAQANSELEETNRGVVALYAELDERADYLQRANELKTRFLSNMTHEFRTPLNSIIGLTRILLQRMDGELSTEQERQVTYIAKSAEALSDLVNDLLDIAKVEAGKIVVRPNEFDVAELFGTLRGMLKPLLAQNSSISLHFDEASGLPTLFTDESKVSQILRNFISNAIKYTERGEVHVSATMGPSNNIILAVRDTGIGIAAEDQERIFEEFAQIDSPLQRRIKGTGLGLPLSRKLAGLLGGTIEVVSEPGIGSTFSAVLPARLECDAESSATLALRRKIDGSRLPVLFIEDNRETLLLYEKYLEGSRYQMLSARTLREAREWMDTVQPVAVVADVLLEAENTWEFLATLKQGKKDSGVPLIVVTMVQNERRALAVGASAFHAKPIEREWLLSVLDQTVRLGSQTPILIVDDDPISRYLLRGLLSETSFAVIEAESGREGLLRAAQPPPPAAIFLDLVLKIGDLDGFEVMRRLKADDRLANIPVIVHTSKSLSESEKRQLATAAAIVPKASRSRDEAVTNIFGALTKAGLPVTGGTSHAG